jgi:ABC-type enterochelin transport system permease subunit
MVQIKGLAVYISAAPFLAPFLFYLCPNLIYLICGSNLRIALSYMNLICVILRNLCILNGTQICTDFHRFFSLSVFI